MAAAKKPAAKKATVAKAELVFDQGYWWIVSGTKRLNVGRNERYARKYLEGMKT